MKNGKISGFSILYRFRNVSPVAFGGNTSLKTANSVELSVLNNTISEYYEFGVNLPFGRTSGD